jgi:hypothetical protein
MANLRTHHRCEATGLNSVTGILLNSVCICVCVWIKFWFTLISRKRAEGVDSNHLTGDQRLGTGSCEHRSHPSGSINGEVSDLLKGTELMLVSQEALSSIDL